MKKVICIINMFFVLMIFNGCSNSGNGSIVTPPQDSFQITITPIGGQFIWSVLADARYTCQANVTMRVVVDWGDGSRQSSVVFVLPAANNGAKVEDFSKLGAVNAYPLVLGTHNYLIQATFTPEGSNVSPITTTTNITTYLY